MRVLHEGLGDSKYRPCPLLAQYVDAGILQSICKVQSVQLIVTDVDAHKVYVTCLMYLLLIKQKHKISFCCLLQSVLSLSGCTIDTHTFCTGWLGKKTYRGVYQYEQQD